jgi:atypical dual specificity phosphatase
MMPGWWIDEPLVRGTSNPTTEQLQEWYAEGFRTVISFLEENLQSPRYDVKTVQAMGYERYNIPVENFEPPTLRQFSEFLAIMERAVARGKVVLHCQGGLGRTGTLAAAYWINKGLSAEQAIQKVRAANPLAIETGEQENSLYAFERSKASAKREDESHKTS